MPLERLGKIFQLSGEGTLHSLMEVPVATHQVLQAAFIVSPGAYVFPFNVHGHWLM